jgi:hypothetical protein
MCIRYFNAGPNLLAIIDEAVSECGPTALVKSRFRMPIQSALWTNIPRKNHTEFCHLLIGERVAWNRVPAEMALTE